MALLPDADVVVGLFGAAPANPPGADAAAAATTPLARHNEPTRFKSQKSTPGTARVGKLLSEQQFPDGTAGTVMDGPNHNVSNRCVALNGDLQC